MSIQSRRQLLTNAVLAGAASLGGFTAWHDVQAAEGPLETATVRFMRQPAICQHCAVSEPCPAPRNSKV